MVSLPIVIAAAATIAIGSSAVAAIIIMRERPEARPALIDAQRTPREKFFGNSKDLLEFKEGQEMQPRW